MNNITVILYVKLITPLSFAFVEKCALFRHKNTFYGLYNMQF